MGRSTPGGATDVFTNQYVLGGLSFAIVSLGGLATLAVSSFTDRFRWIWCYAYMVTYSAVSIFTPSLEPAKRAFQAGEPLYGFSFVVGATISILIMSYLVALLLTIILRIHKAIDKED